jgi:hypothetical protein|tara:strand:+ start:127 stop:315 length:189 start_codon:yes stop_codon:yes gene_type:complete
MSYEDALALDLLSDADLGNDWRMARCGDGEMLIMNTETGERVILPPESVAKLLDVASHRRED